MIYPVDFVSPFTPVDVVVASLTLIANLMSPVFAFELKTDASAPTKNRDPRMTVFLLAAVALAKAQSHGIPADAYLQDLSTALVNSVNRALEKPDNFEETGAMANNKTTAAEIIIHLLPEKLHTLKGRVALCLTAFWLDNAAIWKLQVDDSQIVQVPLIARCLRAPYVPNPELPSFFREFVRSRRLKYGSDERLFTHSERTTGELYARNVPTQIGFSTNMQCLSVVTGRAHASLTSTDIDDGAVMCDVFAACPWLMPGAMRFISTHNSTMDSDKRDKLRAYLVERTCRIAALKRDSCALFMYGVLPAADFSKLAHLIAPRLHSSVSKMSDATEAELSCELRCATIKPPQRIALQRKSLNAQLLGRHLTHAAAPGLVGVDPANIKIYSILQECNTPGLVLRHFIATLFGYDEFISTHVYESADDAKGVGLYLELLRAEAEVHNLRTEASIGMMEMFDRTIVVAQPALRALWLHNCMRTWFTSNIRQTFIFHVLARELMCLNTISARTSDAIHDVSHWIAYHLLRHVALRTPSNSICTAQSPTAHVVTEFNSHIKYPPHYFSANHMSLTTVFRALFVVPSSLLGGTPVIEAKSVLQNADSAMSGIRATLALLFITDLEYVHKHPFDLSDQVLRALTLFLIEAIALVDKERTTATWRVFDQARLFIQANPHMVCALRHGAHYAWSKQLYGDMNIASPPNERLRLPNVVQYDISSLRVSRPDVFVESVCSQTASVPPPPPPPPVKRSTKRKHASSSSPDDSDTDDESFCESTDSDTTDASADKSDRVRAFIGTTCGVKQILCNTLAHCVLNETQRTDLLSVRNRGSTRKARREAAAKQADFPIRQRVHEDQDGNFFYEENDDDSDNEEAVGHEDSTDNKDNPMKNLLLVSKSGKRGARSVVKTRYAAACILLKFCVELLAEISYAVCNAHAHAKFFGFVSNAPALLRKVVLDLRNPFSSVVQKKSFGSLAPVTQIGALERLYTEMNVTDKSRRKFVGDRVFLTGNSTLYTLESQFSGNVAGAQNLLDVLALLDLSSHSIDCGVHKEVARHYFDTTQKCYLDVSTLFNTLDCFLPVFPVNGWRTNILYHGETFCSTDNVAVLVKADNLRSVQIERLLAVAHLVDNIYNEESLRKAGSDYKDCNTATLSHPQHSGLFALQFVLSNLKK